MCMANEQATGAGGIFGCPLEQFFFENFKTLENRTKTS